MTFEFIIGLGRQAVETMLLVSLPVLLVSLLVGLVISIFQAVTQIQEMTITFVPKIFMTFLSLLLFGSWMLTKLIDFMRGIMESIPFMVR
ncbi:MAG: flagellar biosynthesis protein FliQ [Deltaproteobacteria bacterium]|nr:flagellar biosynthesis protein FliQ [Deltaproteobacteria bacterium]